MIPIFGPSTATDQPRARGGEIFDTRLRLATLGFGPACGEAGLLLTRGSFRGRVGRGVRCADGVGIQARERQGVWVHRRAAPVAFDADDAPQRRLLGVGLGLVVGGHVVALGRSGGV